MPSRPASPPVRSASAPSTVIRNTSGNDPAPGASRRGSSLGSSAVVAAQLRGGDSKELGAHVFAKRERRRHARRLRRPRSATSAARHFRRFSGETYPTSVRPTTSCEPTPSASGFMRRGRADERQHAVDQKAGLALVCVDAPCVKAEEDREKRASRAKASPNRRPTNSDPNLPKPRMARRARRALGATRVTRVEGRVTGFEFLSLFGDRPPRVDLGVFGRRGGRAARDQRVLTTL